MACIQVDVLAPCPQPQQQPALCHVGLDLAVGSGPLLQRAEALHPGVRLSEHPEPQDAHHDEQDDRADEHNEQLGSDPDRHAADGSCKGVVGPPQRSRRFRRRGFLNAFRGTLRELSRG